MQINSEVARTPSQIPSNISIEPRAWRDLELASLTMNLAKGKLTTYRVYASPLHERTNSRPSFRRVTKDFEASVGEAVRYSRQYGGAIGVLQAADGFHWLAPLGVRATKSSFSKAYLSRDPFNPKIADGKFSFERKVDALQAIVEGNAWVDFRPVNDVNKAPGTFSFHVNDVLDGDYWMHPKVGLDERTESGATYKSLSEALKSAAKATQGTKGAVAIIVNGSEYVTRSMFEFNRDGTKTPVILEGSQLRTDDPAAAEINEVRTRNRDPRILALIDGDFSHVFQRT